MDEKEFTCIICPQGCRLKAVHGKNGTEITGFKCPRGRDYGLAEAVDPRRTLTTTVKLIDGVLNRLPVKSSQPIPKHLLFPAIEILQDIKVNAPVKLGDVIVKNILNTGADIIATRDIRRNVKGKGLR